MSRDYVAPPFILSAEAGEGEVTWSLGTYTPSEVIRKAFGIERPWPSPSGVFANQPNPHGERAGGVLRTCLTLLAALFLMLVANCSLAGNAGVFESRYQYQHAAEDSVAAFVTESFKLEGRPSNVEIELDSDLDNDWVFFAISLINDSTGQAREATKQLSYYYGSDSDGSWSEGSRRERMKFASVPPGTYFLRVAAEGGEPGKPSVPYSIRVKRDVPGFGFYALAFLAIVIPAFLLWIPSVSFEQRRWSESDYAGSDDSSDHSDDGDDE
jgi:hypothetical protein